MKKEAIENMIISLLEENEPNISSADNGYDKGYAEGYHDALVDVMLKCGIETNEEWFN